MNAAYVLGARLTDAFAQTGFCVAIRGAEGGGKVENLPYHVFTSDDGDLDAKCPSEVGITDRREFELSNLVSTKAEAGHVVSFDENSGRISRPSKSGSKPACLVQRRWKLAEL